MYSLFSSRKFLISVFAVLGIIAGIFLFSKIAPDTFAVKALSAGDIKGDVYAELKDQFRTIVEEKDPKVAIETLKSESEKNKNTNALCHDILHEIGKVSYEKYGSIENTNKFTSDFCNSGYIHGVFESYFRTTLSPLNGLIGMCDIYAPNQRKFDLWQCRHGIGHGLMYFTGGDLDESLSQCIKIFGEETAKECQNGVYMELFNSEFLPFENETLQTENPFKICASRDIAKDECYTYVPAYLSQTKKESYENIFKLCDSVESSYRGTCIAGVATEAVKRNMSNIDSVYTLCSTLTNEEDQQLCASSLVSMYLNQQGSIAAGSELCEKAPEKFQDVCEGVVAGSEDFFR